MLSGLSLLWLQLQLSFNMTKLIDPTADPCVDFHEYACGNFKKLTKLGDDEMETDRFGESYKEITRELRDLLQEPMKTGDSSSTRTAKLFYRSCTDVERLEKLGVRPLKNLIDKYGGWPVVEGNAWNESEYDWMKTNARLSTTLGGADILDFSISTNFKNNTKNILDIDQTDFSSGSRELHLVIGSWREFWERTAYFELMVATAVLMGAPKERAEEEMKDVLELRTDLASICVSSEDRRDPQTRYRPMTIKELKEKYPMIHFDTWFRTVREETGWAFQDSDEINLSGKPYLDKLPEVLKKYSKRTIANFQMWNMCKGYVISLAPSLREHYRKYQKVANGLSKFPPRWEECVQNTADSLKLAVGAMYVKRYISDQDKTQVEEMLINIRNALAKSIDASQWMDSSTKLNAHKKLEAMIQLIAFPSPDIYNESWVMKNYIYANISEDTYLENKISLLTTANIRRIQEFPDPINRTEWKATIVEVNALTYLNYNKMVFTAGIFRPLFYHPSAPDYYNYGRIGSVMGHELTHGFDDQGLQFDDIGNLNTWWTNETLDEFKSRAQCIIDQYGNITDNRTGLPLNGRNTQGENIADNGGVKLAFQAFKAARENLSVASSEHNHILPRMSNFTIDQLYFLSYGQAWCDQIRDEYLRYVIVVDHHSPTKYRVNVPLQNNADFAQAYKCRVGSPMNPVKKCEVW